MGALSYPAHRAQMLATTLEVGMRVLDLSARTVVDAVRGTGSQRKNDQRLERWAGGVVARTRAQVSVTGREKMQPGCIYVIMSNHQSHYDIPILFHALGGNIRMVAKKELFDIPVFGHAMREAGFIEVDRSNRSQAVAALQGAAALLAQGTHLWIAPEGKRSRSGELCAFKKGGFAVAIDAQLPILPVTLSGTRDLLAPDHLLTTPGAQVSVTVHDPILTTGVRNEDKPARDALIERVRQTVASALPSSESSESQG